MASPSNNAFTLLLRIIRQGKFFSSAQQVRKEIAQQDFRPASYAPPRRLDRWSLIAGLARASAAEFTVPIYPLAPHATAETTVATAAATAAELLKENGLPLTITGDSAGGGLTLAVAQQLRDSGVQPRRIILISPWLDATVSDPRMPAIAPHDPMLAIAGLAEAGRIYAGELEVTDPRVSPLFGDLAGLAPATVFTGTADILNIDARRLAEKARATGLDITYHEADGAQHVYPLFPTREGADARRLVAAAIAAPQV